MRLTPSPAPAEATAGVGRCGTPCPACGPVLVSSGSMLRSAATSARLHRNSSDIQVIQVFLSLHAGRILDASRPKPRSCHEANLQEQCRACTHGTSMILSRVSILGTVTCSVECSTHTTRGDKNQYELIDLSRQRVESLPAPAPSEPCQDNGFSR